MRKFYTAGFIKSFLLFSFLLIAIVSDATTYYSKATGNANATGTWGTNADGTGTAPANFTTSGDIFILRGASTLGLNGNWIVGTGVTVQMDGILNVTSNNNDITINGTIAFTNPSTTQITLTGGGGGNDFTLGANATLRTVNVNGVRGANASLPASASGTISLNTAANYEFNGSATQATLGLPATVNALTINNSAGVNLTAAVAVTTLNIGTTTANSILNDNGKQITSTGTLNLTSGTFNIGSGATNTSFPAFNPANVNIAAGTTVNYNSSNPQTIAAVNYANLTSSANGARTLASSGTIGISGTFTKGGSAYTLTGSTVSFNGSSPQTIPAFTFNNLIINNTAGISSIGGDITVNNSLALTNGVVTTGANKIVVANGAATRTNGWVAGNLQQKISATGPITFAVGGATNYRPVTVNFSTLTTPGNLSVSVTQSDGLHSSIASSGLNLTKTLKRYWTLASSGVVGTYDATFDFAAADNPGGATGSFVVRNYTGTAWTVPGTGTRTATSTQATGLTTFGDFAIGEINGPPVVTTQPSAVSACQGNNTTFTSASTSTPTPTVKWQRSLDNGANWVDITAALDGGGKYSNFTTNTLNITGADAFMNNYLYRSVYTHINGSVNSTGAKLTVTQLPTITLLDYAGSPFANIVSTPQPVTLNGTNAYTGGTFTSDANLSINASTGAITPSTSTVGNHTITYTIAASGGCNAVTATTTISITTAPTAQISYSGNPFCENFVGDKAVTLTGTSTYTGGTYASSSPNLTLNTANGTITPGTSAPGTYTVTYTIPAFGGHPSSTTTTDVTITRIPSVTISYLNGPFCTSDETANPVTFTNGVGAYMNGTFSAPGLSIDALSGAITPSGGASGGTHTVTYTIPASGGCAAVQVSTTVDITLRPNANLSYNTPLCLASTSESPTLTGTTGGTYSASPAGLSIVASSGIINPSISTVGDYNVFYTIPASGACGVVQITTQVSIVASPTITTFNYPGQTYCNADGAKAANLQGTGNFSGGSFSATPSGLNINAGTGLIVPASSTPGIYTVTYITPNCPVSATTQVEITAAPSATISYASNPFCLSEGSPQSVTIMGDLGGTFSAPSGVSIDPTTGAITPSTGLPGTYTINYTFEASGTCPAVTKTTTVTITNPPVASINYAGSPYCTSLTAPQAVTLTGSNAYTGGAYSSTSGLTLNTSTGAITPGSSTPGTYTVTYVTPTTGGCSPFTTTASVTITEAPTAAISYAGPFCISDASSHPATLNGTGAYLGGSYTAPFGLSIDGSGNITPASSLAGTYTVTYTIPTSAGCAAVPVTTSVTINPLPNITSAATGIVCSGIAQNYTITSGLTGTTYNWSRGTVAGISNAAVSGQTSNPIIETLINTTSSPINVVYSITPSANGCIGNSFTYTVTVNPKATITSSPTGIVCSGIAQNYAITSGVSGATINWSRAAVTGISNAAVTGQTSATIAEILTNTTNSPVNVAYTITASANGCTGTPFTYTVTVNPKATITSAATGIVCSGTAQNYTIISGVTGATFDWSRAAVTGIGNVAVTGQTSTIIAETLTNTTNSAINVVYNITPSANGCTGTSFTYTVTVNPKATITSAATGIVCSGIVQNYTITSGVSGSTYSWSRAAVAGITNTAATGQTSNPITETLTNTSGTQVNVVYTITPSANGCTGTPFTYTVSVDPISVGGTLAISGATPSNVKTLCPSITGNPNGATINLSGNIGNVIWQSSTNGGTSWATAVGTASQTSLVVSNLSTTTIYRAVSQSGVCSPAYSSIAVLQVIPPYVPSPVVATPNTLCLGQSAILTAAVGYPVSAIDSNSGSFNQGAFQGWMTDGQNHQSAAGNSQDFSKWMKTNNHRPLLSGTYWDSYEKKFSLVTGNVNSTLESPVFGLLGQSTAVLNFIQAFDFRSEGGDVASGKIDISTDGGSTYTNLVTYTGALKRGESDGAPPGPGWESINLDLSNYIGQSNLRVRFVYSGSTNSTWGLDALSTPGFVLPVTYTWSGNVLSSTTGVPVTATPTVVGTNTYTINTTIGGCPGGISTVTINVNPLPTITLGTSPSVCQGTTSANLPYTNTTNIPTKYSIDYNAAANTAGLVDIVDAIFPATSPIILPIPFSPTVLAAGTYTGTISVSNANLCGSNTQTFTITVRPLPTATISGGTFCKTGITTIGVTLPNGETATNPLFTATPTTPAPGLVINSATGVIDLAASAAGTYTVSYSFTGANGCSSTPGSIQSIVVINSIAGITSQPADLLYCPESNTAVFSVAASGTSNVYQWQFRQNSTSAWANVPAGAPYSGQTSNALTITSLTYIDIAALDGYQYQVLINPLSPCPVTSGFGTLSVRNIWKGTVSQNWNDPLNWSAGLMPVLTCENVIILDVVNQPILEIGNPGEVNSLIIMPGATATVKNNTLKIAGTITTPDNALDATEGKIDLNGNIGLNGVGFRPAQTIAGKMFATPKLTKSGRIKDLQISNPSGATVAAPTVTDTLNITGTLSFGNVNNVALNTNNNITLISDASGTARVADLTNDGANTINKFNGQMIVERYIPAHRAWRLLTTPLITSQTINQAWQEGAVNPTLTVNNNPHPGYGTHITGIAAGTDFAIGYDAGPFNNFSLKVHDRARNTYLIDGYRGIEQVYPSAPGMNTPINFLEGYALFVRGGRNIDLNLNTAAIPTNTVLRAKGTLKTGTQTVTQTIAGFNMVGNPFASTLNLTKIRQGAAAPEFVYVYDPRLGSIGAFQTLLLNGGNYDPIPGGGTYADVSLKNLIQSGQAFFIQSAVVPGSVTIPEDAKDLTSNSMVFSPVTQGQQLRTNLYAVNTTTDLLDAALTQYSSDGNNGVDGKDAMKIPAISAGTYLGMLRDGKNLIIERRQTITVNDTIFFNLMTASKRNYRFEFIVDNLEGGDVASAFLEDAYLKTATPVNLNGTTTLDFTVNTNAVSSAFDRFRLVFKAKVIAAPLPFTFKDVQATLQTNDIAVKWITENENDIKSYDVETSANGQLFVTSATIVGTRGTATENYQWLDANTTPGMHYYRIRSINDRGDVVYSEIVSVNVNIAAGRRDMRVYPNPVTEGRINVMFRNQPEGNYNLRLTNALGQVIFIKQIYHAEGTSMKTLRVSKNMVDGMYKLEITRPDKSTFNINVILQ